MDVEAGMMGKKIMIGDDSVTIVGVAKRWFYGLNYEAQQDIWWPISLGPSAGWGFGLLARLKPGVSLEQAQAEMAVVFQTVVNAPDADPFVHSMNLPIGPAGNRGTDPLLQLFFRPLSLLMSTVG